jgi:aminoglycoside phosphotransferase (APT) family kinase protein
MEGIVLDDSANSEACRRRDGVVGSGARDDVAVGNLLVEEGRLSAVIDFGTSEVGDPSCDVAIAWTLFGEERRDAFRAALRLDDATWVQGRDCALWKALITLAGP